MTTPHLQTLIIGAGQAGLSTGYHLQQHDHEFLIVDAAERIGDSWRSHYDSLRLFTPAYADSLDGLPFPGEDPWAFPTGTEYAAYLEQYAHTHDLPVRMRTRVSRLSTDRGGGYVAELDAGHIRCDNVVIATGSFGRTANVPTFASRLDPRIHQLHSSEYRRPAQLPDGPVLVVGASHSGLDIAYELGADRPTVLVGPDRGHVPVEWGSRRFRAVFPVIELMFNHVLTRRTPMGRKMMPAIRHHGAPQLRVQRRHLAERGVEWVTDHVTGVSTDGLPRLADGRTFDVATVVWATGFRHDYAWLDLPLEMEDGWPREYRGVVESLPGLYFCGLAFQYAFASMEINGVGRDAAYIATQIAARGADRLPAVM